MAASRGEELNTRLTVTDDASKVIDNVSKEMADLEDKPHEVDVTADTSDATREISALDSRLDGLTDDEKRIVLSVQARDAQRDLDRIARDLANAHKYDNEEIAIRLNARGDAKERLEAINRELADIEQGSKDANGWLSRIGERLNINTQFSGIGSTAGKALAGGFAAVGVGALLVESISRSWDEAGGLRRITGAFRLSADEADKYGKIAGDLYADNWGESLSELQSLVATTAERIAGLTEEELRSISSQVQAVTDTWGYSFDEVIRSTSQLLENGLANSAQHALDLVVSALQSGGDEAGDLLDTIDEYSQHWAAMGLSGEEAMNQIIAGLQQGQRDTDKVADAVKEMRLRVVEDTDAINDAYRDLGLNADEMRDKFGQGGSAAREAFDIVIAALGDVDDPIERNRLGIELIGTQFEDLGPTALDILSSIEGKLLDTQGAAQGLADTVGQVTPWERLQRQGETALLGLGNVISERVNGPLDQIIRGTETLGRMFGIAASEAQPIGDALAPALDSASRSAGALRDRMDQIPAAARGVKAAVDEVAESGAAVGGSFGDSEPQVSGFWETVKAGAEDATEAIDETVKAVDSLDGALNKIDQEQALRDIVEQFEKLRSEPGDRDAVLSLMEDVLRLGQTYDDLPDEVVTRISALIDQGQLNAAYGALQDLVSGWEINLKINAPTPTTDQVTFHRDGRAPSVQTAPAPSQTNYFYTVNPTPRQVDQLERDYIYANGARVHR